MSFKDQGLLNKSEHGSLSRSPPSKGADIFRSQRSPDLDRHHSKSSLHSGDDSTNLRRYVHKRSLTNSFQSGHRSGCTPGTTGSSGRSILAGEKRHNDGSVVRTNQGSGNRPSGGYLSPSGLENVSFCSGSTGSNSQKSGSQSGSHPQFGSPPNFPEPKDALDDAVDVTPEKRRKLEELAEEAEKAKNLQGSPKDENTEAIADDGGAMGTVTSSKSPRTDTTTIAMDQSARDGDDTQATGQTEITRADQAEQNPFSLFCSPSTEKLLLSGQSVARGTTQARRKTRVENRTCVSFDVNTAGRALLLKNGLDSSRKLHVLGRGGFGVVVKAVYQGQAVAVKIIPRHNKSQRSVESCLRAEMNAINLEHPNIVRAIRIFGFEERNALVIMELAGSISLQTMLNDHRTEIPFVTRVKFSCQIACALEFCHERRILHLDVKPSNILISGHETCKLGDFGCSRKLDDASRGGNGGNGSVRGTVVYQAPEVLRGCMPTEKADIYSLGITMWQMITREYPFHGERAHVVMYLVGGRGKRPQMPHPANHNEENYMKMVEHCWMQNPILRPSAVDIQRVTRSWKDSLGNPLIT